MKNFISIIYVQTNSISNEKIGVGLLAISNDEVFFEINTYKLKIAGKLSSLEVQKQVEFSFDLIKNKIDESKYKDLGLLGFKDAPVFTKNYITYLNKYSDGILQFDLPKEYSEEINQYSFKKIFEQFIGNWEDAKYSEKQKHHTYFSTEIKTLLKKPVFEEKADIDFKLEPQIIHGLLAPKDISLITKNGNILAAQAIDFSLGIETVIKNVYEYEIVINSLQKLTESHIKKNSKNKFILLFNKPKANSKQEKLLNEIVKTKKIMELEEQGYIDILEKKLKQNNYSKFSTFLNILEKTNLHLD